MKNIITILFVLISSFYGFSKECECNDVELINFIMAQEEITEYTAQYLMDYLFKIELNSPETKIGKIGIYKFGLTLTHSKRYLLLKDEYSCKIVDCKNIEDGIIEVCEFLKRNTNKFSFDAKLKYIEASINVFKSNLKTSYLEIKDE